MLLVVFYWFAAVDLGEESVYFVPFNVGDRVQVKLDVDTFRALQDEQHGGWNPEMELVGSELSKVGVREVKGI